LNLPTTVTRKFLIDYIMVCIVVVYLLIFLSVIMCNGDVEVVK